MPELPQSNSRRCRPASLAFLAVSIGQAAANISFESLLVTRLRPDPHPLLLHITYDASIIVVQALALFLTLLALCARSERLASAATVLDLPMLAWQAIQLTQSTRLLGPLVMRSVSVGILALGFCLKSWLVWQHIRKELGWPVYRMLGADTTIRSVLLYRRLLLSLVVLFATFFVQLWAQHVCGMVLAGGAGTDWALNAAVISLCAVTLALCLVSTSREKRWLVWGCIGIHVVLPGLFIYALVIANQHPLYSYIPAGPGVYRIYVSLSLATLVALDIAIAAVLIAALRTFGRGLRPEIARLQELIRTEKTDLESITEFSSVATIHTFSSTPSNGYGLVGSLAQTTRGAAGDLMASTKYGLKEASMRLQAIFSSTDLPRDLDMSASTCNQLTSSLGRSQLRGMIESTHYTVDCFSPDLPLPDSHHFGPLKPQSQEYTQSERVSLVSRTTSDEGCSNHSNNNGCWDSMAIRPPERLSTPIIPALVLSIEELVSVNGELALSGSRQYTREIAGVMGSPASWSFVSSISFRASVGTAASAAKSPAGISSTSGRASTIHNNQSSVDSIEEIAEYSEAESED